MKVTFTATAIAALLVASSAVAYTLSKPDYTEPMQHDASAPFLAQAQEPAQAQDLARAQIAPDAPALVGAEVNTSAGDRVGIVEEIVQAPDGVPLIVVSLDEALGMGEKLIAFEPEELILRDDGTLSTELSQAEIGERPEYTGS